MALESSQQAGAKLPLLKRIRLSHGFSVRGAAGQIGIAPETLAKAERGESIHPGTAKLIADFYEIAVLDFWCEAA